MERIVFVGERIGPRVELRPYVTMVLGFRVCERVCAEFGFIIILEIRSVVQIKHV